MQYARENLDSSASIPVTSDDNSISMPVHLALHLHVSGHPTGKSPFLNKFELEYFYLKGAVYY